MFYRLYVWQEEPELVARETGSKLEAVYQWRSRLKKEVTELEAKLSSRAQNELVLDVNIPYVSKSNA